MRSTRCQARQAPRAHLEHAREVVWRRRTRRRHVRPTASASWSRPPPPRRNGATVRFERHLRDRCRHGGEDRCRVPGRPGNDLHVRLPIEPAPPRQPAKRNRPASRPDRRSLRILVIEDEAPIRRFLEMGFSSSAIGRGWRRTAVWASRLFARSGSRTCSPPGHARDQRQVVCA